jgi:hypothetical protein
MVAGDHPDDNRSIAMAIIIEFAERLAARLGYDLFWLPGSEFVLCNGFDDRAQTLAYWRRIDGRWVDCKGV